MGRSAEHSQGSHLALLAEQVRRRRKTLGYTQQALADRGGPDRRTQQRIESASSAHEISERTLRAYDEVLEWLPGSAGRILYEALTPLPLEESKSP